MAARGKEWHVGEVLEVGATSRVGNSVAIEGPVGTVREVPHDIHSIGCIAGIVVSDLVTHPIVVHPDRIKAIASIEVIASPGVDRDERVVANTPVEAVDTGAADYLIVAFFAVEDVVPVHPLDQVVPGATREKVVSAVTD